MKDTSTNYEEQGIPDGKYPIVKCVMGHEEIGLKLGHHYTVTRTTKDGHLELLETSPPLPYTCFHKERFEYTGEALTLFEIFPEYLNPEYYPNEDYFVDSDKQQDNGNTQN